MPPTTLKLPSDLKQRIRAVVETTGESAHAFMLQAIERETRLAEQRLDFVAAALEARAHFARTRQGYRASDVHADVRARTRGRAPVRAKAIRWPR